MLFELFGKSVPFGLAKLLCFQSQFTNANRSLDNSIVSVQLIVISLQEALKSIESKLPQRIQIVIILILNVRFHMRHDVRVFLHGLAVLTLFEVVWAADLLEPQALVVVDVLIVAAVFKEDCDCVFAFLDLISLYLVTGGDRIQSTVSCV